MNWKEGVDFIVSSKSRTFLSGCGFFILGIFLSLFCAEKSFLIFLLYGVGLGNLFLLGWNWKKEKYRTFLIICLLFILGFGRGILYCKNLKETDSMLGEKNFLGVVVDSGVNVSNAIYTINPDNYENNILLYAPLYPRYTNGDVLSLSCRLDLPDSASYQKYLQTRKIFAVCSYPKIKKVGQREINFLEKRLSIWREKLSEQISLLWPEPRASLLAGILYGERGSMPPDLKNSFSNSGLSHIVAVSGYNTSVVAVIIMAVFVFVGFWRRQAFYLSGFSLVLFTLFTGASASVVRAAVMAIFVMVGSCLGRSARMINSLSFAAALMLLLNPLVILDVGFQLSFLATIGVSYVGPHLQNRFGAHVPEFVAEIIFSTLGALLITLPLTIYYFSRLPLLALVANILVASFIPIVMLFGFLALLLSFLSFYLALPVAFAADIILRYIIWVSKKMSIGSVGFHLPLLVVIFIYLLIIYWLFLPQYVCQSKN